MILTALAIGVAGAPIAYAMDRDPTGTRWDRIVGAVMWPLVVLIIAAMLVGGAGILICEAIARLRRFLPC